MQFLCIQQDSLSPNLLRLLAKASHERNIVFTPIDVATFDYTTALLPPQPYLLYNTSVSAQSRIVQEYLLTPRASTFFVEPGRTNLESSGTWSTLLQQKMGVAMPRTIFTISRDRTVLRRAVDYLGGFPLIVKAMGGSHGVGVMKVDSLPALFSLVDYLSKKRESVMLRQFINVTTSARLIVLGHRVVDSIEYQAPRSDFRTNGGRQPTVYSKVFPRSVQQLACQAVAALGLEFGGVDLLIDHTGQPYVAEVNFPCNFARAQLLTGVDTAGQMIDHLLAKAQSHHVSLPVAVTTAS